MWILVASTQRDISPGEELTIDRNEAAGNNRGFFHELKDPALLISILRRNVHPCVYNGEPGTCPAEHAYIRPGLTPAQWDQFDTAVVQKRDTDQRVLDRPQMNDVGPAGQA
jgi:hypothetical protein